MDDASTPAASDVPPGWMLAAVAAAGVVVPGLLHYYLSGAGLGLAADAAWIGGYGLAVLAVWYGWLRHLDLSGPDG